MREDAEFLRNDSPRRICSYTRSQAMALYEEHRRHILKELVAREVQRRVTNKILGKKEAGEDLLFAKHRHDTSMKGISGMLTDAECSASADEGELTDTEQCPETSSLASSMPYKPRPNAKRYERFVDLEACVSGDEESSPDADEEDCDDLSFIASSDEDYEAPTEKHNKDMLEINRNILRNLKRKFAKKVQHKAFFGPEDCMPEDHAKKESNDYEIIEEENTSVSEDMGEDVVEDFVFSKEEMEYPHEAKPLFTGQDQVEFTENVKLAEKRLGEGKLAWDFDEGK
ncbi:hypothetical protein KMI_08g12770 [Encephalitozoon hellem]|nr:hypothetical protein KMI_08g12770 [Encephalitozoon hellem]